MMRQFPVAVGAILALEIGQRLAGSFPVPQFLGNLSTPARWAVYASFVMAVVMFGVYRKMQFIYFQF